MFSEGQPLLNMEMSNVRLVCKRLKEEANDGRLSGVTYAQMVVDSFFNNPRIDLVSVFPNAFSSVQSLDDFALVFEMVNSKSVAFQTLVEVGGEGFDRCMSMFGDHLERTNCKCPLKDVAESAYMQLLADYITFFLPPNGEPQLSIFSKRQQLSTPYKSSPQAPRTPPSPKPLGSSFGLLREDVLRQHKVSPSSRYNRVTHATPNLGALQLLSSVYTLVRSYCSLSSWPSDYRLMALRFVLKNLHTFLLMETESSSLYQMKQRLHCDVPFSDVLFEFYHSLMRRWPQNRSFPFFFDTWLTWIRPWRYLSTHTPGDMERTMKFVQSNYRFYTELSDEFWQRNVEIRTEEDLADTRSFITTLTAPEFTSIYEKLHYDIGSGLMKTLRFLEMSAATLRQKIRENEAKDAQLGFIRRFVLRRTTADDTCAKRRILNAVMDLIKLFGTAGCVEPNQPESVSENDEVVGKLQPATPLSPWRGLDRGLNRSMDPVTKVIVPAQLLQGLSNRNEGGNDVSDCLEAPPPLVAPLRDYEVWWLARWLYRLSGKLNSTQLARHLSARYNEQGTFTGSLARLCLDPAYPRSSSRVLSGALPVNEPCFNLRRFARYKFVVPVLIFFAMMFFIPFSYDVALLAGLLLYSQLL